MTRQKQLILGWGWKQFQNAKNFTLSLWPGSQKFLDVKLTLWNFNPGDHQERIFDINENIGISIKQTLQGATVFKVLLNSCHKFRLN